MTIVGFIFALIGAQMLLELYAGKIASYFITALIAFAVTAVVSVLAAKKAGSGRY
ncbi:hypothetical protein Dacet_1458 [Denitrovibrio acetiphilus DSM 12809]|uniref:Uncharacterized protein n=1 Tax=Denitrovibrio acetiphilus (strain DSM 12809 / NBRC 114555 / N2460) TaxID=522772 RepID=D4H879_DENA2|nr:hypothetical protein [Denitrovibrio acetiphilus]ADD68228.1 hypothetical protein Dacet_1458 [Denitrovibrio acetiphilus DSM 12809]